MALVFFLLRTDKLLKSFSKNVSNFSVTVTSFVSYPVSTVKTFIDDFKSLETIREENSKLKEKLAILETQEDRLKDLDAENESLKASLEVKHKHEVQTILTGKVLSRSTLAWMDWLSLDIGMNQGVSENMLVLSNGYLVGMITQVSDDFSTVHLLTNTGAFSEIPVKFSLSSGDVYGILSGYDVVKNAFWVTKLNKKIEIAKDSQVFTSGLDGETMANIKIGKVIDVVSKDEMNQIVYVASGAGFDHLTYLTLIGK